MDRLQKIVRERDLPTFVGLRRTAIKDLIAKGEFPRPVRLTERSKGWLESELLVWQGKRIAERDGGGRG